MKWAVGSFVADFKTICFPRARFLGVCTVYGVLNIRTEENVVEEVHLGF